MSFELTDIHQWVKGGATFSLPRPLWDQRAGRLKCTAKSREPARPPGTAEKGTPNVAIRDREPVQALVDSAIADVCRQRGMKHFGRFETEQLNSVEDGLARAEQYRCNVEHELVDDAGDQRLPDR